MASRSLSALWLMQSVESLEFVRTRLNRRHCLEPVLALSLFNGMSKVDEHLLNIDRIFNSEDLVMVQVVGHADVYDAEMEL